MRDLISLFITERASASAEALSFFILDLKVHFVPHKDDGQLDGDRQNDGQRAAGDARHHIAEQGNDAIALRPSQHQRDRHIGHALHAVHIDFEHFLEPHHLEQADERHQDDRIPLTASTGFRTKPAVHGIFPFESGIVVEIFTKYYYFEAILYKPSSQGM